MRLGDPEALAKIMEVDPYYITQDNGAGAPLHFATTYKQLDMVGQPALQQACPGERTRRRPAHAPAPAWPCCRCTTC